MEYSGCGGIDKLRRYMRRLAPVVAVLTLLIAVGVGVSYWKTKARQSRDAPNPPAPLPEGLHASASGWEWSHASAGRPVINITAQELKHVREPSVFDLAKVELKIFHLDGQKFDRVLSPKAQFSMVEGKLYSDAAVDITMGVQADGGPQGRLLSIQSSGVAFESKTGKAETARHATFRLDVGEGEADGAVYDPQTRELHLLKNVKLIWRGNNPKSPPMYIEAAELIYKELEQKVYLLGWSRFSRNTLKMSGGPSDVTIEDGNIRLVNTVNAVGADTQPAKTTEFAAEQLEMIFRDRGVVERIAGQTNARLDSASIAGKTQVRADRMDMSFTEAEGAAFLDRALANGGAQATSLPAAGRGETPPTRVLRAETIELRMRPGGEELEQVLTHTPGTLEFLPNHPSQLKRLVRGERMDMQYGSNNKLKSYRASVVSTVTDPDPHKKNSGPQKTWSKDMLAVFNEKNGEMTRLDQWGDFRFEEGDRRALSERATLDQASGVITLSGNARIWDLTGATDAESIAIDDRKSITVATGRVRTVREPERQDSKATYATAKRMVNSANDKIRYEGDARLWQAENRLEADWIEIDRPVDELRSGGGSVNTLTNEDDGAVTVIRSKSMRYTDREKVSFYEGGVVMTRPGLTVTSQRLRGYLSQESSKETSATVPDSGLEKAFAEGDVDIVQVEQSRNRHGTGDVAEYYVADNRVILEGPLAQMTETKPGLKPTHTKGNKLTWLGSEDKLLVDGSGSQPALSRLRRKKK